jgi:hypothetical protein
MPSLESSEYNLKVKFPRVAKQWHPTKNGDLKPEDVNRKTGKKVWWVCEKGHEWSARVVDRARGSGCPRCAGGYEASDSSGKTALRVGFKRDI